MRKLTLFLFFISSFVQAGVSLELEHPRYPSHEKDNYSIQCKTLCEVQFSNPHMQEGTINKSILVPKLEAISKLGQENKLPKEITDKRKVLYVLKLNNSGKKIDLILGYPMSYSGKEFTKYSEVISIIEDIKRTLKFELQAGKK